MWFAYRQNAVQGSIFGPASVVFIEAHDGPHADRLALRLGIYFSGVVLGIDCPCCGDRWHRAHHGHLSMAAAAAQVDPPERQSDVLPMLAMPLVTVSLEAMGAGEINPPPPLYS